MGEDKASNPCLWLLRKSFNSLHGLTTRQIKNLIYVMFLLKVLIF